MAKKTPKICKVCESTITRIPDDSFLIIQTNLPRSLLESLNAVYKVLKRRNIVAVVLTHEETIQNADDEFLAELGLVRVRRAHALQ